MGLRDRCDAMEQRPYKKPRFSNVMPQTSNCARSGSILEHNRGFLSILADFNNTKETLVRSSAPERSSPRLSRGSLLHRSSFLGPLRKRYNHGSLLLREPETPNRNRFGNSWHSRIEFHPMTPVRGVAGEEKEPEAASALVRLSEVNSSEQCPRSIAGSPKSNSWNARSFESEMEQDGSNRWLFRPRTYSPGVTFRFQGRLAAYNPQEKDEKLHATEDGCGESNSLPKTGYEEHNRGIITVSATPERSEAAETLSMILHDPKQSSVATSSKGTPQEIVPVWKHQLEEISKKATSQELPKQETVPVWKQKLDEIRKKEGKLKSLQNDIQQKEFLFEQLRKSMVQLKLTPVIQEEADETDTSSAFTPLTKEEEEEVKEALHGGNRNQILVKHEASNIDLTRAAIQCLKPGVWLNDEVINLYLELLKEREIREPEIFLKCHYFNTFFFNKLYRDTRTYNYKAVRRWTTQKKLGYSLLECSKIFVPIHKDVHWCLAVINVKEKKILYLDSLGGNDEKTLQVLARYLTDEAKDKLNQDIDTSDWTLDCPKHIPEQLNGCDCGMFMIKYADFHSRGDSLKFSQDDMDYFRRRTVLELLQKKAR